MQKEIIKIMPDYQCSPLWRIRTGIVENIFPDELPLSESLKSKIVNWQEVYDSTLNLTNPAESGFKSDLDEIIFDKNGINIWRQLINELNDSYEVRYFSIKDQILY